MSRVFYNLWLYFVLLFCILGLRKASVEGGEAEEEAEEVEEEGEEG